MDDLRKLAGPYVLETERNSYARIATLERQLAEALEAINPLAGIMVREVILPSGEIRATRISVRLEPFTGAAEMVELAFVWEFRHSKDSALGSKSTYAGKGAR